MVTAAWGAPKITVEAEISDDLQTVKGTLQIEDGPRVRLVDTQSRLPMPEQDADIRRTFPGRPEQGWMHIEPTGPGTYVFYALLPRRLGASGFSPGDGLFAHGVWLPQPTQENELIDVDWNVQLQVPDGHTVVLNGLVGKTQIEWSGQAQVLSLAVIPRAHLEPLESGGHAILWIRPHPPSDKQRKKMKASLELLGSSPKTVPVVVIECPLRRRLIRPGEQQLYLSDRALRVSGKLWTHHAPVVARGILQSGLPIQDLWSRDLAATALADATIDTPSVEDRLRLVSWIPEIEALLHDGRLPFYSDIFDASWSGDRVQDDIYELISADIPGRIMARRLSLLHGLSAVEQFSWDLSRGVNPSQAAQRAGLPQDQILDRRPPPDVQDYSIEVLPHEGGWRLNIERSAPESAPPEAVQVEVDGLPQTWVTSQGPDSHEVDLGRRPRRVELDPSGIVRQDNPSNDVWPRAGSTTVAFFPYQLNITRSRFSGAVDVVYRPIVHGRNAWRLSAATDEEDLLSTGLTYYHFAGPLRDRRTRPIRLWIGAGAALLDPDYRPLDSKTTAVGLQSGVAWDTRDDYHFPLQGHRVSLFGSGGMVPGADQWGSIQLSGVKVLSAHGRLAWVSRLKLGLASGGVEHRLLSLGGSQSLLSLPAGTWVGDRLIMGVTEVRAQVVRGASLPLPAVWLADINLSAGLEGGLLQSQCSSEPCTRQAIGATAGISFVGDVLGVRPSLLGIWAGVPLNTVPEMQSDPSPVQIVVRFTQPF